MPAEVTLQAGASSPKRSAISNFSEAFWVPAFGPGHSTRRGPCMQAEVPSPCVSQYSCSVAKLWGPGGSCPVTFFPLPSSQAAWCSLPSRVLLVLTSRKGIQMYESDGSVMVYWHALEGMESSSPGQAVFARGVAATGQCFVCVGTSSGAVLVFDVPSKGANITLSEVLEKHTSSITDMGAELCEQPEGAADLVTADDCGSLCVWRSGEKFKLVTQISASECTCSSVKLWNGVLAAGYGNGQICLYEAASGILRAKVSAHARWIYALDVAPLSGKLLSAAEDSFVQVWRLSRNPSTGAIEIEHCHGECVTDTPLCGARFCNPEGSAFALTGFELSEIVRYVQV